MNNKRILSIVLLFIMIFNLLSSSIGEVYAIDMASFPMQLATGTTNDNVVVNYNKVNKIISISGSGTILEANWIKLAHAIEGGETSYSLLDLTKDNEDNPSPHGWHIPEDINMVFEVASTIQLEEDGFKGQDYGWFQDFKGSIEFNGTIDTSNLTDMSYMFYRASDFNSDISNWKTAEVTDMSNMFRGASKFKSDLSNWDVGNVEDMFCMFRGANEFTSDLSKWNVSKVTNTSGMFFNASNFTSDLSSWEVVKVTTMNSMFRGASSFSSDLASWDVSNVEDMYGMFYGAKKFTSNLASWDVSNVEDMYGMFYEAELFTSELGSWNVSNVTNTSSMFYHAINFTSDLSSWNVSNVTDMSHMFHGAELFTSDLASWNVAKVTTMNSMFRGASSFSSNLASWNVSNVTDMYCMFYGANMFDSDLASWNVSNVTDMYGMFYEAKEFTSDLSKWDVSNVTNTSSMFCNASKFDSDLASWNVSNVTDMSHMFRGAKQFTSNLASWNVSNVSTMNSMFRGASNFSSDLASWNVSNVTDMYCMFYGASNFTSNLFNWQTGNVTNMKYMFYATSNFMFDLSNWDITKVTDISGMFVNSNLIKNINLLKTNDNAVLAKANSLLDGTNPNTVKFEKLDEFSWTPTSSYQVKEGELGSQVVTIAKAGQEISFKADTKYELYKLPVVPEVSINDFTRDYNSYLVQVSELMASLNNPYNIAGTLKFKNPNINLVNAGEYNDVKLIFIPNNQADYTAVELNTKITISKATPTASPPNGLTAVYGQMLKDVTIATAGTGDGVWSFELGNNHIIDKIGNIEYAMHFTPTNSNYNSIDTTVTINISKADFTPNLELGNQSATYGQQLKDVTIVLPDGANYTASWQNPEDDVGNAGVVNNHEVILTPNDSDHYNTKVATVTVNVAKANPVASPPNGLTAVYGQTLNDVVITTAGTGDGVWRFTLGNSHVIDKVGNIEYAMHFTPTNSNYNSIDTTVTINISKADFTPNLELGNQSATYGQQLKDVTIVLPDGADYAASWQNPEDNVGNAGDNNHNVVLTPTDSDHYNTKVVTVTVNVTKANPAASPPSGITAVYGQTLADVDISSATGDGVWSFNKDDDTSVGEATKAEENGNLFSMKFTPNDLINYNSKDVNVNIKVSQKDLIVTGATVQNKIYDGTTAATVTASGLDGVIAGDEGKVSIGSIIVNFADEAVGENKAVTVTEVNLIGDKAGNYKAILPTGLTASIYSGTFLPSPAFTQELRATYGQHLKEISLIPPAGANYTVAWKEPDYVISETGKQQYLVILTPTDYGKMPVELAVKVWVDKAEFIVDTDHLTATAVYGQSLSEIKLETDSYQIIWNKADTRLTKGGEIEYHQASLVPKNDNYQNIKDVTVAITVEKAPAPTLKDVELEFKAPIDRLVTTTLSAIEVGLPSDSGVVDYKLKVVNDSDGIISEEELRGSYLSYQLVAESADKNGEIELEAEMANYESSILKIKVKTVAKDVPELTLGSIVKDYDKKPITADELNKLASFGGKKLTGEWQFSQNLEDIITAGKHIIEVIFTADDSDNYAVVKGSVSIEIEKVPLKIVGVKAIDRYYQKNRLDVELTGGELQGVLTGDEVGFELNNNSDKSGRVSDDSVGQDRKVVTDITLTGKDSDNYYLIQPEDILVTISSLPVYDDEDDEEESEAESSVDIASPAPDIEAESEAEPESTTVEVSAADKVVETETKPTISEVLTSTEVMTQTEATTLAKGELINKIVEPSSEVKKAVKPLVVEGKVFEDTESEQWYAPAVKYVVEKGLMQGTSENAFSPEIDTTRAEIVTVIYRLENISGSKLNEEIDLMFSDVTEDQWYTKAVKWGAKEDIVAGFTDLTFRPQVNITREQLVALLYRYAEHKGYNVNKRAELSKYNDSEKIGDYAKESMSWAVAEGLISGRDEKTLAPIKGATRAEISSVFKRFSEKYDKWLIAR